MPKIMPAALGLIIFIGAGCAVTAPPAPPVPPVAEAPRPLPTPTPPARPAEPAQPADKPAKEVLTFQDELKYAQPLGTDNCVMPAGASMEAEPKPTKAEFYPANPDLKFTMDVPYSDDWSFLGKRLPPIQMMYDEVNYYFGKLSMNVEVGQDIYCGFRREYQVYAEKGTLAGLRTLSTLTLGKYQAATVEVETDNPAATKKPVELVVQAGDLLVHFFQVNDETKRLAETIQR